MRIHLKLLASATLMALAACTTAPTQPSQASPAQTHSGFLQDYSLLAPNPDSPGHQSYVAPGMRAGQYRSFIIDEPVFMINTGGEYEPLSPARLQAISNYYKSRMTQALGTHYRVVDAPGPGVARVRIAVVGLVEVTPQFRVTDLVPVKALFNAARMVADETPHMLRMSIEGELLDSQSKQLLGAAVDSRESTKTVAGRDAQPSDDQVHDLIDFWVARFVARLDHANGHAVGADGRRAQ